MALLLLQGELFPRVTCRIEGTVEDMDTKEPIAGAVVRLFSTSEPNDKWLQVQTDRNGCFIFDDRYILPGEYYVQCYSKGYVPFLPDYYQACLSEEKFRELSRVFVIKEGEIKHIRLKLEKGGTLKGVFLKKTKEGTSNFKNLLFLLEKGNFTQDELKGLSFCKKGAPVLSLSADDACEGSKDGLFFQVSSSGEFTIQGLEAGDDYFFVFNPDGYRQTELDGVAVEKGKIKVVDHTIDLTDPTGIQGVIRVGGRIPESGTVYLFPEDMSEYKRFTECKSEMDPEGRYSCLCLDPGLYNMKIYITNKGEMAKKRMVVEIEAGITKQLNLDF